jgi:hypothetical protein
MKSLNFQPARRSGLDVVSFQPVLTQQDWECVQKSIAEHKQLSCNLSSTNYAPHDYWVSYVSLGGPAPACRSLLAMLFRRADADGPVVACQFERSPDEEDWRWLYAEEYDNDLSDDEFAAIFERRQIK